VSESTVRRSESIAALAAAMCKAQAELKNPPKDSVNPHYKSRYADLATVRDTIIPVLVRHGLSLMQFPSDLDGAPALTTILAHTSGEFVEGTAQLNPKNLAPQDVGSALTYMRRYALQSVAGVAADDDDDGHAASHRPQQQAKPAPRPQLSGTVDNLGARQAAVDAYAACQSPADLDAADERVLALKAEGRLSDADLAGLRPAAREAHARIKPKAATAGN
jgi:hypothetical protein